MAIFNQPAPVKKDAPTSGHQAFTPDPPPFRETPTAVDTAPAPRRAADTQPKESLIASDLTIEGKIEGTGHVRIAGRFKGDVNVQGDLTIEAGAKLTGGVRAKRVIIAGELEGNIDGAQRVELLEGGVLVGDVKAGALTVAAGSRMRGQADFGWEEKKPGGVSNGAASNGMEPHAAS
ncbi:polymer-forming cytoskeletal protein [Lysobacter telluris]|uniref:bactofilin family protein n=1 Tax=Cognatiluteimonas telluris TaxID=1104775 RepID=UPI00140B641B